MYESTSETSSTPFTGVGMPLRTEHSSGDSCLHPRAVATSGSNRPAGTTGGHGRSQVFHALKIRPKSAVGMWEPNAGPIYLVNFLFSQYPFSAPQNACKKSELRSLFGTGWSNATAVWGSVKWGDSLCPPHQGLPAWLGILLLWQTWGGTIVSVPTSAVPPNRSGRPQCLC